MANPRNAQSCHIRHVRSTSGALSLAVHHCIWIQVAQKASITGLNYSRRVEFTTSSVFQIRMLELKWLMPHAPGRSSPKGIPQTAKPNPFMYSRISRSLVWLALPNWSMDSQGISSCRTRYARLWRQFKTEGCHRILNQEALCRLDCSSRLAENR